MATIPPEITDRAAAAVSPLAVTVQRACQLSGLGPTTIWAFLKDGRLEAVRVPGVRRTLVSYASLERLLAPSSDSSSPPKSRRGSGALQAASTGEEQGEAAHQIAETLGIPLPGAAS
jgi:hypothetical protein